ncbi:MAG TPA: putative lipopolysaccharide heptosyltransferase III [Rhodocyclaceae bacterium]|nr:putative lipopolysaccharide heptosyltransferase III [Rhodocyclaceae bacterium]
MDNFKALSDAIPLDQVRRVLVIKLRHHGDVLLSSPVFSVLRKYAPEARVDALVYADTAPMLTLHPDIAEVHTVDRGWKKLGPLAQLRAEWRLFSALRARDYDLVVHLTEHWRGAWLARLLGVKWAVGPERSGKRWRKSFTHRYGHPRNALRHVVEANLDALRRIGIYPTPEERRLVLVPGRDAEDRVAAHLRRLELEPGGFIHIHPASRWFFKCWPAERMAELIHRLQAEGHAVVLTAAPSRDELAMVEDIQARLEKPVPSLAGQLSLKDMAALTARAKLFIGVDSAPMHIAAAVGTPTVALFGPSGDRQWGPWGVPFRVVASDRHPCRPCGIDGCGGGKVSDCLVSLTAGQVHAAAMELLIS